MKQATKEVIRAQEERLWRAQLTGDVAALDELISDNLLFTGLDGALESKAGDLEQHRTGRLKVTKLEPLDFQAREVPGGVITSVKMDASALVEGREVSAVLRYTRVWIQEAGRWVIAGGHMSMVPSPSAVAPQDVLDFWFSARVSELWFDSTPEFDRELRERFEPTLKQAVRGELREWAESPAGALALVIVLDQFPLNMYRGKAESYATGDQALAAAKAALARGFDRGLPRDRVGFLYLPFMHSESLADQDRSVELFTRAGLDDSLRFASHHRELIRRFGRFPHRNAALGRRSTPEELAYLASKEAFLG